MKKNSLGFIVILAVAVVAISWLLSAAVTPKEVNTALEPFYQTLSYILNTYYEKDEIDLNKLMDYAIDGLVKGLGDDFSYYENPESTEEKQIELEGEYGGLGIEVTYDSEYKAIKVISPMYGTPAWRTGLKAGDRIVTIDDEPVSEMTYMEAVRKLRGQPGTTVRIKVLRENVESLLSFEIVREVIQIIPVKHAFIETSKGRIGYTLITRFGAKTSQEMAEALDDIFSKGIKGLIIDLRDNPGGYLNSAIEVASYFIDNGIIVKTKNAYGVEEVYESKGNNYPNIPMVVLVNGGSASAAEILTGALKDHQIARVVGTKTFGKGSVQTGFPLNNGGTLYLTTAHYMTPSGKDIHRIGIEPDVFVEESTDVSHESVVIDYTKKIIDVNTEDPFIIKGLETLLELIE
ncbi:MULTISPECIES: S41 family peptidase [Pseudothermotoga]|jgi:carboxyl-terminal processing protease|uniref:Carboxyl-terminal protease n=1 Tax=Pseudothermotoga lettingae (strain ATCC BAA-301 / DSM 14385 / NBRC 107922 / TMO) TaxID=416591 RepID=A8F4J5_PSELT|nr:MULTISPECIES: S41 family peptidase [Pseudothermotoga]ABV33079.1 carboxyl-terminal protease [Pseudothermotoga lettingae TMO]KUK20794.1 MAG: Carboxyl-terminal protease [Pseudothermotoga lettingae]MDI3494296.1 carboxyl-terminal processing protease [Pseudothermotoga sp.]MDK2884085.1 carboxyl-terminal processing protease [Pseudothermotoga sp.]GLI47920.1 peptidase S41 [Pseudothermotoga lettingae TMO]